MPDAPAPDPLRTAWLAFTEVTWHDPAMAYDLADLADVPVDDDGTVDAARLRRAVRRLAQAKRFLVREAPAYSAAPTGPSGAAVGGGRRRTMTPPAMANAALVAKYPALRR